MANIADKILATVGASVPTASLINTVEQAEDNPSTVTLIQSSTDVLLYDLQAGAAVLSLIARVGCNNRRALHLLKMAEYIPPYARC